MQQIVKDINGFLELKPYYLKMIAKYSTISFYKFNLAILC